MAKLISVITKGVNPVVQIINESTKKVVATVNPKDFIEDNTVISSVVVAKATADKLIYCYNMFE